jgi:hypothetical protein
LIEGARVSRQSVGVEGPAAHFIAIAEAVIAAFAQETNDKPPVQRDAPAGTLVNPLSAMTDA